ncbi:MAG: hypothetical protein ACKVQC_08425 [Elusimicrobiota bacterium]
MTAVLIGIVFIFLGIWGMISWSSEFIVILKGFLPLSLFFGGVVAVMAGVSSLVPKRMKDEKK